jgi:hypothetical protein
VPECLCYSTSAAYARSQILIDDVMFLDKRYSEIWRGASTSCRAAVENRTIEFENVTALALGQFLAWPRFPG